MGNITIPGDVDVWDHELDTARALASTGQDLTFLPRREGKSVSSADIQMSGIVWELKSPTTTNLKHIQKVLRRAGHQSSNVIIDTARIRGIADSDIESELKKLAPKVKSIKRLRMIDKRRKLIVIR